MQTYTHLAVGIVGSKLLFPDDIIAQVLTVIATLAPDVPTAAWYALDKIQGKKPFSNFNERKGFNFAISAIHSLVVWLPICFLLSFLSSLIVLSVMVGVYIHLFADVISHTDKGPDPDPSWVWPLEHISSRMKLSGLFDYRVVFIKKEFTLFTPMDIGLTLTLFAIYILLLL